MYVFIILSIPIGSYLASQFQTIKSSASEPKKTSTRPLNTETPPVSTPLDQKLSLLGQTTTSPSSSETTVDSGSATTVPTSYGPTLSLKIILEGRPQNDQSGKLFVGIMEGGVTSNPRFLLNFSIDLPNDGQYDNLSLAGLTAGNKYTAILKGAVQIATSSAFTMSPTVSKLNNGDPITLLTGDLNDDNVINSSDYSIEQKALGSTSSSSSWNGAGDFNKDGVINAFDLGYITKNFGQTGASGAWYSPVPTQTASPSASLTNASAQGGPPDEQGGYWIWVPK